MDSATPPVIGRDFFDRARARLTLDVPAALHDHSITGFARGDLDTDPAKWEQVGVTATRAAAVLVPVVDHPEPGVLLTMRTSDLPNHAGQIAFPGGKMDPHDATPLAAALRETQEEIGLGAALIEPIGYLDLYLTFTGFRILPVLARVTPNYELTHQRARGRRRLRGAARVRHGRGQPQARQPRLEGRHAPLLRDAVRGAIYLGRDGGDFAEFV